MGPLDTLNSVLINSIVFAFVPMLTAAQGAERTALFLKLTRCFVWAFSLISLSVMLAAPWLMRALAPGLDPQYFGTAVNILRILALSTFSGGVAAVHCAMLYTHRRFGPAAFYQAALNVFTIAGALCLWKFVGVYAFAIGYTAGAFAQLAIVYFAARSGLDTKDLPPCKAHWREILMKPAFFVVYAAGHRPQHYLHPRLCDPRRSGNGRRAGLLHARRRGAAGASGQPDFEFAAAGDRPPAQPLPPARSAAPDR